MSTPDQPTTHPPRHGDAWLRLINADGSDEWLTLCSDALAEVQAETSRRNAAKLLAVDPVEWALAGQHAGRDAARLIHPGAESETP